MNPIEENAFIILKSLIEKKVYRAGGNQIKDLTALTPEDINDAVGYLESKGGVDVVKLAGTVPYSFGIVKVTSQGKYLYHEREKKIERSGKREEVRPEISEELRRKIERNPDLIEIEFKDFFYDPLIREINLTHRFELFTSTMFLARKLLENLVIEILRIKYPPNVKGNLEIYYNTDEGRFHDFTILLKNLEERKEDFVVDVNIITEFISLVKPFRPRANANAHSIIIVSNKDEVLKYNIPKMTALLLKLWNNLKLGSAIVVAQQRV